VPTRLSQLRQVLKRESCSHILLSDSVDVEYLTGFHSSNVLALISAHRSLLLTDFRYRSAARRFCAKHSQWRFVEIKENGFSALPTHVPRGSRLGIQANVLTVEQFDRLASCCKGVRLVKLSGTVTDVFTAKMPAEVSAMRRAARIGDAAFARIVTELRPGISEHETALLLEEHCRALGSEGPSFDTIVLFGARSALPHGRPGSARLKRGDFVLLDFGCMLGGLCSDMTRTVVFGKASETQTRVYKTVLSAQTVGRKAVRAGVGVAEVDKAARDVIIAAGYGDFFGHATGHGVGRRIHEAPRVAQKSKAVLPPGAVVTVEPGIYLPDVGGVRIEDMVVVTGSGANVLTRAPRQLMEIAA